MAWSEFRDRYVPNWLRTAWIDPVWSKVIAALIIGIPSITTTSFLLYFTPTKDFIKAVLYYKLPVYSLLSAIGIGTILNICYEFVKPKFKGHSLWDEQLGNYSFWNLYRIMSNKFIGANALGIEASQNSLSSHNILILFYDYSSYLSTGITSINPSNDSRFGFLYLAPELIPFQLVEADNVYNGDKSQIIKTTYRFTALGLKFHASLSKVFDTQEGEYEKVKNNTRIIQ